MAETSVLPVRIIMSPISPRRPIAQPNLPTFLEEKQPPVRVEGRYFSITISGCVARSVWMNT
jgi:hypothetical protein